MLHSLGFAAGWAKRTLVKLRVFIVVWSKAACLTESLFCEAFSFVLYKISLS